MKEITSSLLNNFDRIAEAPDAVPRLRRFILDLAVRGKLVEQDSKDEPAVELLKRIWTIAGQRAAVSGSHKGAPPFSLPPGWSWARVGEITTKTGSGSTPRGGKSVYKSAGVPFLRSQNIYDDGLRLNDVAYIDLDTHTRMVGTALEPGDLLLNITGGSIGRCSRIPDSSIEANISQHVAIIRLAVPQMRDFMHKVVLSPFFQSFVLGKQTGAGRGGLPKNWMDEIPVPLPPLAEIDPEAEPYRLPSTWQWSSLDQVIVAGPQNGISPKPTTREDAPKAITLTATTSGVFNPAHFKRVEAKIPDESGFWLSEGDLLFQRGNTREYVGIAAIYDGPPKSFLFPDLMIKVRVSNLVNLRFIHLAAVSPPARTFLSESASGAQATMPKINQSTLVSLPIPLPPLAEQHRIVAKVDELMAVCDQLEAQLTSTQTDSRRLLEAVLHEALAPAMEEAA